MSRGQITDARAMRAYLEGTHGRFTLVSKRTGARFTYRVRRDKYGDLAEIDVLVGPQNTADYVRCAWLSGDFTVSDGQHISQPAYRALAWFVNALRGLRESKLAQVECWHEGVCCRCGRALTVPASIASGIGPTCAGK